MAEKETGGLAFPFNDIGGDCDPGMTLRDYFAAKYMHGVSANHEKSYDNADLAEEAYQMADAMLAARSK